MDIPADYIEWLSNPANRPEFEELFGLEQAGLAELAAAHSHDDVRRWCERDLPDATGRLAGGAGHEHRDRPIERERPVFTIRPVSPADWSVVPSIYFDGIGTGHATFEADSPEWET